MTTMFDIKSKIKQLKNTVLQMTPLEIKVRECTSNDSWGVKLSDKLEVADHTYNYEDFKLIMSVIRIRLADVGKDWRHVQKGIQLVEFLVINGSDRCLDEAKDMQSLIRHLKGFKYVDDEGKDWGVNVRDAAKHFLEFMKNEEAIKEEREKAKEQKNKYEGFSRSEAKYKARSSGTSSSSEKKKKPATKSYDDDDYDAPKKSSSRSSIDEDDYRRDDEEERRSSPPPSSKSTSTGGSGRPRKPSTGSEPQTSVVQKPQQQKEDTLIDFFDTQPTVPANTGFGNNNAYGNNAGFGNNNNNNNNFGFSNNSNNSNAGFNPRGGNNTQSSGGFNPRGGNTAQTSFGGNQQTSDFEANFDSSGFDDAFGNNDSFGTGASQEKKDSTLFDLSSGLVNLDLNDSGKKQPQQQNTQPQTTNMTLKELKRLQGTTTPPNKPVMNTPPFNNTSFPPSNQQQWGNQPPVGYGQPPNNQWNSPPTGGNNWNNTPPMGGQGGYPPRNQQPPMGYGNQPPQQ